MNRRAQEEDRNHSLYCGTTISSVTNSISSAGQTIQNQTVSYYQNASGYLVYPSSASPDNASVSPEKLPAIIMIHENRGLNDNIKSTADILAKQGYVVLAVDLFQGQVTDNLIAQESYIGS